MISIYGKKTLARKQKKRGGKRARKTQKRMKGGGITPAFIGILAAALVAVTAAFPPYISIPNVAFDPLDEHHTSNRLYVSKKVYDEMKKLDPASIDTFKETTDNYRYRGAYYFEINCAKDLAIVNTFEDIPQLKEVITEINKKIVCNDDDSISNPEHEAEIKKEEEKRIKKLEKSKRPKRDYQARAKIFTPLHN